MPVFVSGNESSDRLLGFPTRFPVIRRGRVEVRLGEPLSFSPGTNYQDAA